jgi:hypothetical protein
VNNLEILVRAGRFDPKKHSDCLALQPATINPASKQYKTQNIRRLIGTTF